MIASLIISARQLPQSRDRDSESFFAAPAQTLDLLATRLRALGLIAGTVPAVQRSKPRRLSKSGVKSSIDVTVFAQRYRLETTDNDSSEAAVTVALTLKKLSSVLDRLLGKDAFDANDAFVRLLQDVLEREPYVEQVEVQWR